MTDDKLYNEFIKIAKELNRKLGVTPILYGSLGLEIVTKLDFSPQDIDILVPLKYIKSDWESLKQTMEGLNYTLVDLHEHKFVKGVCEV